MKKTFLTVEEVAEQFGINSSTVYRLSHQGLLPGFKVGGQWRFSKEMLDSWVMDRVTIERLRKEDQPSNGI